MGDANQPYGYSAELRRQAEKMVRSRAAHSENGKEALSLEAAQQLLHELQVHQIELEMQNEELRRAQAELEVERARYCDLYDFAPTGYLTVNGEGQIVEANLTAAGLLGLARSELVRLPISHFILPEDQDIYYLQSKNLSVTSRPQACEIRLVRKGGSAFWAHLQATVDSPGLGACRLTMDDITEQKRVEEALRESQESLAGLFDHAVIGLYRTSIEGRPLLLNHAICRMLGFAGFEDVLKHFEQSHRDDLEFNAAYSRARFRREIEEKGYLVGLESPWMKPNGEIVTVRESAWIVRDSAGNPKYYEGVFEDITEQKRAEEALRVSRQQFEDLAATIRVGTYILRTRNNATVAFEYASRRFLEVFDTSRENLLEDAQAVFRVIHPEDQDLMFIQKENSAQRRIPFSWSGRILVAGKIKWVHLESTPRVEAGGDTLWHGFVVDITERKQQEAERIELEAQNRQLKKAESLGRMAGSVAHHFNNKLQAVMASLDLMSELPKGVESGKFIAIARQATEKAAEVSRLMLLYLGQTALERKPYFLSEVCQDWLPSFQNTLSDAVTLEAHWPSPGPVVEANADQFQQAFDALLRNALEALGETGGGIRLDLKTVSAKDICILHRFPIGGQLHGSDFACLEVIDTGCGIADGDFEMLFDPFFSTKFVGRGLGLSVVLGIVQAHGGVITVESKLGKGSKFRVYLPVSTGAMPTRTKPEPHAFEAEDKDTILVVDDDGVLLESTGIMLERMGFKVISARDGVRALELFRENSPAIRCVLTDLTMPRMDGWETLTAMRQLDPRLPVILASGYNKAQVLSGAHPDRPQAFLGKPFGFQQLRDALSQALAGGEELQA